MEGNSHRSSSVVFENPGLAVYRVVSSYIKQNSYVIIDRETREAAVVDCGVDASSGIYSILSSEAATLSRILLTHEHYDHIRDLNELRNTFPDAPVIATDYASAALTDTKKNLSAFHERGGYSTNSADRVIVNNRECLRLGTLEIEALRTPGHTPGSACYFVGEHVFTGDTLIKDVQTVTNLPGGNKEDLRRSLATLFAMCSTEAMFYPGHGETVRVKETFPDVHLKKRLGVQIR